MHALLSFLKVDDIPAAARPSYLIELRHMLLWGMFANLIDGAFSSIVVAKTFHSPLLVPIVWATPMLAHLLSFVWGVLVRGRAKVRTFVLLAVCAAVSAGSIAFTPSDWHPWGGWLFATQIALARIFMSGLVTVRTSIWKSNYPQSHRARIAGRIQMLNALLMLAMGASISSLFDRHAEYYRFVYPAIAVLGLLSLVPLRRLHIRGEARELEDLHRHLARAAGQGALAQLRQTVAEAATILRRDRAFSGYCTAQYLLGSANFMVDPILTLFLTQKLGLGYFGSYLFMEQVPTVASLLTIRAWSHLFDRVGVLRFRVVNSTFWLSSIALVTAALWLGGLPLPAAGPLALGILVVGRLLNGAGRGGGTIAWNLGHLHFAGPHDHELYMGIHVALTGLRGMIMPFVGTAAYGLVGPGALLLGVALATAALAAFRKLARRYAGSVAPTESPRPATPSEAVELT